MIFPFPLEIVIFHSFLYVYQRVTLIYTDILYIQSIFLRLSLSSSDPLP